MSNRKLIRKTVKAFRVEYADVIDYGIKKFLPRLARKGNDIMNAFIDQVFVDAPGFVRHAVRSQVDFTDMVGKGLGNLVADDDKMEVFIEEIIDLACILMDAGDTIDAMIKAKHSVESDDKYDSEYWVNTLCIEDGLPRYVGAMSTMRSDLRVYPTRDGFKFNGSLVCASLMDMSVADCAENIIATAQVNEMIPEGWYAFFEERDLFIHFNRPTEK